ncbi:di-heme oxidoredictase family protein [Methylopila sp. Yamaguchi]|uniref:di-heme oxidoredictase family protein n=1 Tax=Methylopila sp. Yamaguchi TaxID=1437817 RepID=UPI0011AF6BA9|nr:di-heme oxidoredictase family protein [Methylopila sp. Yamaguchi]
MGRRIACGLAVAGLTFGGAAFAAGDGLDVAIGKAIFGRMWVPAPASTRHADGLGPLFAARSCASCHSAEAGRTRFRLGRDDPGQNPGLVVRLGSSSGAPDPVYGVELQPEGLGKAPGEGRAAVAFAASGKPSWRLEAPGYGPLASDTAMSARVAPSLAGLSLLERVPEAAVLALAEAETRDGVSGRPHWIKGPEGRALGRFGWKASEPTLAAQAASAFALDLGLSTERRPESAGDCTPSQTACRDAPQGAPPGEPEVAPDLFESLVVFLERRPAPSPPAPSPRGVKLFASSGCAACHAPSLPLAEGGKVAAFTDLLLHDMGPGLDDGVGEQAAASAEWRTAPLWGLSRTLAQGSGLLHDGRAATVADAVRWHDGEAAAARSRFDGLTRAERKTLVDYVSGL